jgi:hypothetical protein
VEPVAGIARRSPRRRPSGAAPPLPRQLNVSGWGWLVLAFTVVVFCVVILVSRRAAFYLLVADHFLLSRFAELRTPWLTTLMRTLGSLATSEALLVVWWVIVAVLVVWRRWRHLFVTLGALVVVQNFTLGASEVLKRPRPVGIEILGDWSGFAMPSRPVAILATVSVIVLYSLVPARRSREWGKLAVALILALTGRVRVYLAQDAPSDALVGLVFGVAIRWPRSGCSPRRRSTRSPTGADARPTSTSAGCGHDADHAWPAGPVGGGPGGDQGVRAGRLRRVHARCASRSRVIRTHFCSASCTPSPTCGRTGGTSSAAP